MILPDSSELELPDGATGLDAARAIGPKLAEQAVLVRMNGQVQDVRAPLADGEKIQILTTRDAAGSRRALRAAPLTAHLLAEAVRRLYPGVKIAIGPPIENGFYYDFEFPEPIGEDALEHIEAELQRELDEGRTWERGEISRRRGAPRSSSRRASRTRSSSSTPRRATSRSTRRASSPTSAAARTCRTRRRSRRSS